MNSTTPASKYNFNAYDAAIALIFTQYLKTCDYN